MANYNRGFKAPAAGALTANNPVNSSRKEFLEDLPGKVRNTVRGVDLALINKAITAIMDGQVTINGTAPDSRHERFIVIASYFKALRTPLNMFFTDELHPEKNYTIAFSHEDKPYTIEISQTVQSA
jgi:hypothetical protein